MAQIRMFWNKGSRYNDWKYLSSIQLLWKCSYVSVKCYVTLWPYVNRKKRNIPIILILRSPIPIPKQRHVLPYYFLRYSEKHSKILKHTPIIKFGFFVRNRNLILVINCHIKQTYMFVFLLQIYNILLQINLLLKDISLI